MITRDRAGSFALNSPFDRSRNSFSENSAPKSKAQCVCCKIGLIFHGREFVLAEKKPMLSSFGDYLQFKPSLADGIMRHSGLIYGKKAKVSV